MWNRPTVYFVWRRSDGYVAATTYHPHDYTDSTGRRWTYERLLETPDWDKARNLIESLVSM